MRALFVAPVTEATGETLTAVSAADDFAVGGHDLAWLVSPRASGLVPEALRGTAMRQLGPQREENLAAWRDLVGEFGPDIVVFADYPLLFLSGTACPLWERESELQFVGPDSQVPASVTFDHLGLTQLEGREIRVGPLPSTAAIREVPLPADMSALLPCPLHEPEPRAGGRGVRCRGRAGAEPLSDRERAAVRAELGVASADRLILHAVPGWAGQLSRMLGSDFHRDYGRRLVDALPESSAIVSINDGSLLAPSHRAGVEVVNLRAVPAPLFDAFLVSADLFVTDNPVSSSLGRAISSGVSACVAYVWHEDERGGWGAGGADRSAPAAASYDLFPIFPAGEVSRLGVVPGNTVVECFAEVNLAEAADAAGRLLALLSETPGLEAMRGAQARYNGAVRALPTPIDVIRAAICTG